MNNEQSWFIGRRRIINGKLNTFNEGRVPVKEVYPFMVIGTAITIVLMFAVLVFFVFIKSPVPSRLPDSDPQPYIPTSEDENIVCIQDAMICPDGSAVGRVGPNCEFAPCP